MKYDLGTTNQRLTECLTLDPLVDGLKGEVVVSLNLRLYKRRPRADRYSNYTD